LALLRPVLLALQLAGVLALGDPGLADPAADPAPAAGLAVDSVAVDPAATEAGLRARTGDALDQVAIEVSDAQEPGAVDVRLRGRDGSVTERRIALMGDSLEERSRELAAGLALLLESADVPPEPPPVQPPPKPEPPPPVPRPRVRGWLGIGPRVELGKSLLFEGGGDLMAGVWLAREHVQPLLSAGFTASSQDNISLMQARVGAGLAIGAALGKQRRIWLGGHVLGHALWARAHELRTATLWLSSTEVGGLVQYRGSRFFLGLRTGVDLTLPPLLVRGTRAQIQRGPVRYRVRLKCSSCEPCKSSAAAGL
jgi:hypothetical protein